MTTFPSIESDGQLRFGIETNTAEFLSDLNMAVQHKAMPGARWRGVLTFTNRGREEGRQLKAFVMSLQGPSGRFDISPPDMDQQGTLLGSPVVSGGSQTGKTINTSGWTANQADLIKAGDYFEIGGELKICTADASSNASGLATISFVPPIRVSPAGGSAVVVSNPLLRNCYLANDNQAMVSVSGPYIYGLVIDFVEDVT